MKVVVDQIQRCCLPAWWWWWCWWWWLPAVVGWLAGWLAGWLVHVRQGEEYFRVVQSPPSFSKIRAKLDSGGYDADVGSFLQDVVAPPRTAQK